MEAFRICASRASSRILQPTNSLEAHYAMDATEGGDEAITDLAAGTAQVILISSAVSGDTTYTGSGYITNVTINSSKGSSTTLSISYEGTGTLTAGTVS